jgi:nucleoside 2-deoxyribosyltransferase
MTQTVKRAYLAGPYATEAERRFTEAVMKAIKARLNNRLELYVQHIDTGILQPDSLDAQRRLAFSDDIEAMNAADILILLLDNEDSAICWEMGYGYARGVPMIALWTDLRAKPNRMLEQSGTIVNGTEELLSALVQLL